MAGLLGSQQQPRIGGLLALTPPQKAGLFDYALAALAGGGIAGAATLGLQQRRDQRNYAGQAQRLQEIGSQAEAAGLNPQERLALSLDPKSALDMLGKRLEPVQVTGGNTLVRGSERFTAPVLRQDGNLFGTQTADAYQATGERGATIAETETGRHNLASEVNAATPEGFMPRLDASGKLVGFDLDPNYGRFSTEKAAAGATRVNVPITLPAQNEFSKAFATKYADDLSAARVDADKARQSIQSLQQASDLLARGAVTTGAGANVRLQADKWGALLQNPDARQRVADTETFRNLQQQQVPAIARQLGGSNAISEGDRKFAEQLAGGDITLDRTTLARLIKLQQQDAQAKIARFNNLGQEAYGAVPSAQGLPRSAFGGEAGGSDPPDTPQPSAKVRRYNPATGRLE